MKRAILYVCCIVLLVCTFTACSVTKTETALATVVDFDNSETTKITAGRYEVNATRTTNYYLFIRYNSGVTVKYCVSESLYNKYKIGDEIEVKRMSNFSDHGYAYWIDDVRIEYCVTLKDGEKTPHDTEIITEESK